MKAHELGKNGEGFAVEYLLRQGYIILTQNYRSKTGEIDIVARDGDMLCFVEVKTRAGDEQDPFEAVDRNKQSKLARTALSYLVEFYGTEQVNARFDVLAVYEGTDGMLTGDLLKDAFYLS